MLLVRCRGMKKNFGVHPDLDHNSQKIVSEELICAKKKLILLEWSMKTLCDSMLCALMSKSFITILLNFDNTHMKESPRSSNFLF